jgi:hypothetical protein
LTGGRYSEVAVRTGLTVYINILKKLYVHIINIKYKEKNLELYCLRASCDLRASQKMLVDASDENEKSNEIFCAVSIAQCNYY